MSFDYDLDFEQIDFRLRPELYRIGRGEQGVLLVEPYKSEILPHWRFKNPDVARASAARIYELYLGYRDAGDFAGMDMARKFLQMGWTRSLRYANHRTGKKYVGPVPENRKGQSGAWGRAVAPSDPDPEKLLCAKIFRAQLDAVLDDPVYVERVRAHRKRYEPPKRSEKRGAAKKARPKSQPRRASKIHS